MTSFCPLHAKWITLNTQNAIFICWRWHATNLIDWLDDVSAIFQPYNDGRLIYVSVQDNYIITVTLNQFLLKIICSLENLLANASARCNSVLVTCVLVISTCKIFMVICNLLMPTCNTVVLIFYISYVARQWRFACEINEKHVYVQYIYVNMHNIYVIIQHDYVNACILHDHMNKMHFKHEYILHFIRGQNYRAIENYFLHTCSFGHLKNKLNS